MIDRNCYAFVLIGGFCLTSALRGRADIAAATLPLVVVTGFLAVLAAILHVAVRRKRRRP